MQNLFFFKDKHLDKLYQNGIKPSKKQLREKGLYIFFLFSFLFLDSLLKLLKFSFVTLSPNVDIKIPLIIKTSLFFSLFLLYYWIENYEISRLKNPMTSDCFYLILSFTTIIIYCENEQMIWINPILANNLLFEGIKIALILITYFFCFSKWKMKLLSITSISAYFLVRFHDFDIYFLICDLMTFIIIVLYTMLEEKNKRVSFLRQNVGLKQITKEKTFNSKITLINEKERLNISDKILDNIEESIIVVDRDANIIRMNDPIIKLFKSWKIEINDIVKKLLNAQITSIGEAPDFILNMVSPSDIHLTPKLKVKICNKKTRDPLKTKARTSHLFHQFEFNAPLDNNKSQIRQNTYGNRLELEPDPRNKNNDTSHPSQFSSNNQGLHIPVRKAIEILASKADFFEEKEKNIEKLMQINEDDYRINCDIFLAEMHEASNGTQKESSKYKFHLKILTTSFRDELRFIFILKEKQSEAEIRDLQLQNENKSKTLSFVSHEMRTPLNCIVGMLAVLENIIEPSLMDKYVLPAIACGKHLMNLLNDLLDVAQIQAGKFKLVFVEFDLKALLSDVLFMINIQAKPKGLELILEWDNNLSHIMKSDPNRIRQIVINLLGNALKFTQKGYIRVTTEKNQQNNRLIHIKVKDSGLGIKEDAKDKLFKAFGKLDQDQDENECLNSQGVGLGLLISNILARTLGPSLKTIADYKLKKVYRGLNVFSEYGKGAEFEFIIENKNETDLMDEADVFLDIDEMNAKLFNDDPYFFKIKEANAEGFEKRRNNHPYIMKSQRSASQHELSKIKSNEKIEIDPLGFSSKSCIDHYERNSDKGAYIHNQKNSLSIKNASKSKEEISSPKSGKSFFYMSKNDDKNTINNHTLLNDMVYSGMGRSLSRNLEDAKSNEVRMEILKNMNQGKKCNCPDLLIVDDSQFNIVVLIAMLEAYNFKLDSAYDGDQAINKVQTFYESSSCCREYKLIFLDIEMPIKNGYETYEELKDYIRKMALENSEVIITTGHTEKTEHKKLKEAGLQDILTKPILKGALMDILVRKLFFRSKYPVILYPGSASIELSDKIME